jgi:MFS family permease
VDIAPAAIRGAAFGLRQSLDTAGAFIGPLMAVGLMLLWQDDFRKVFWVAVVPGLLAVLILQLAVKEPPHLKSKPAVNPIKIENLKRLSAQYWWIVVIGAVFTLARFSEAFLVLRAQQCGIPAAYAPLLMVAMNIVYALSAYPFGKLSDKMPHGKLLAFGILLLMLADMMLAYGQIRFFLLTGVMFWGLHLGVSQGLLAKLVADNCPEDLRGTAYGLFNLVSGAALLPASVLAGWLWDGYGAAYTFYAGAVFSFAALVLLFSSGKAKGLANY